MKNDFMVLLPATIAPLIVAIAALTDLLAAFLAHLVALPISIASLVPILYASRENVYGNNLGSGKFPRALPLLIALAPACVILVQRRPDFSWRRAVRWYSWSWCYFS
ncbi:MAG: hypothetical protein LBG30_00655 [Odoribacteraceae bacterium]|jgi:hypothetical protein|nr:hypothetical protein [Odoribacteraceae bacterium]